MRRLDRRGCQRLDAVLLAISIGQAQANGGRAILGNGGSATRHSGAAGLLRAKSIAGVQAVLAVGGDSTKHPETILDCRLGGRVQ